MDINKMYETMKETGATFMKAEIETETKGIFLTKGKKMTKEVEKAMAKLQEELDSQTK